MQNLLSGDAKRFFLDHVDGYATSYQQPINKIEKEYNWPVRQDRVKNSLNNLRISTFTAEGLDRSAALPKIYLVITKLSRQGPLSHGGDAHKVEFLRKAVVGPSWSHEPLSRVATNSLTFQHLYRELEAALQPQKGGQTSHFVRRCSENQRTTLWKRCTRNLLLRRSDSVC